MEKRNKRIVMMASIILVITAVISGTLAWLYMNTESVVNTFTPANVDTAVEEDITINKDIKQNVKIQNTGNIQAYVAARVAVSWQDGNGNMMVAKPDIDYEIVMAEDLNTKWVVGSDGTYYHKEPVNADAYTSLLIKSVNVKEGATIPTGYNLVVEILSSGIQVTPVSTVTGNWPVTVVDGNITAAL